MSQSLQIIDELELALNSNSIEQHNSILKKVTALFLGSRDSITEEISSVFDDVILDLKDDRTGIVIGLTVIVHRDDAGLHVWP